MGDVVRLDDYRAAPANPGNGAREALVSTLIQIPAMTWFCGTTSLADYMLISLWSEGFHVVPHDDPPDVA